MSTGSKQAASSSSHIDKEPLIQAFEKKTKDLKDEIKAFQEKLTKKKLSLKTHASDEVIFCTCQDQKDGGHKLKDFLLIKTEHYVRPHGCTGGDYYVTNPPDVFYITCGRKDANNKLISQKICNHPQRGFILYLLENFGEEIFDSVRIVTE